VRGYQAAFLVAIAITLAAVLIVAILIRTRTAPKGTP
jgi:hypothetical protein